MIKVRFAPSPTGKLHVGNIRIAILNYLFAKKNGGHFVLRIDDTDEIRSTKESEELIIEDLEWLGIAWDEFYKQSERIELYDKMIERLKNEGRVYQCFETKEELALRRKLQMTHGVPPVYNRAALELTEEQISAYKNEGRQGYWRFKLNQNETVRWNDLVHGEIAIPLNSISDPILVRPGGRYMYTFASVVDDVDIGITHVIRGDDHITNTAAQIDMFRALSGTNPEFGHVPLMTSADGSDVSKRTSSPLSVENMRKDGVEPMAIWDILATLGTSRNPNYMDTVKSLTEDFSMNDRSLSRVKFNISEVYAFSKKIVAEKTFDDVKARLIGLGLSVDANFWNTIRNNINSIYDAKEWDRIFFGDVEIVKQDRNFVKLMLDTLCENFDNWIGAIKEKSGRKGSELYHPIRIVLTSRETGPELKKIFYLLGLDKIRERIEANLKV